MAAQLRSGRTAVGSHVGITDVKVTVRSYSTVPGAWTGRLEGPVPSLVMRKLESQRIVLLPRVYTSRVRFRLKSRPLNSRSLD